MQQFQFREGERPSNRLAKAVSLSSLFTTKPRPNSLRGNLITMGNAPIQKAPPRPPRPFERIAPRRSFRRKSTTASKQSTLLQLVARRDWQKVLIRASIAPSEITLKQTFSWYGVDCKVLPLHLACALEAPLEVVEKLLAFHQDTASVAMTKVRTTSTNRKRRSSLFGRKHKSDVILPSETDPTASSESSPVPLDQIAGDEALGLQIGPSGNLEYHTSTDVVMDWDLKPLLQEADCLLPLHIACLYRASPGIIAALLKAYPSAVESVAWGMLPIHMLCSNFSIPTLVAAPKTFMTLKPEWHLADSITHLVQFYPESVQIKSFQNGMTPVDYIEETMEDGAHKNLCLNALNAENQGEDVAPSTIETLSSCTEDLPSRVPSEIFCDESTLPSVHAELDVLLDDIKWKSNHPLYILMSHQDWEGAYDLLEEHPEQANKWQYGIEMDEANEPQLWKRLPVHHACRFGAPVGLLSILLRTGPVSPEDPYTGCLPIHLTCRYAPSMDTIQALLYSEPSCAKRTDSNGRLALHLACIKGAPTDVVQKLVTAYPASVAVKDKSGKTPLDYCSESIDAEVLKIMKRLQAFLGRVEVRKRKENSKKTVEKVSADTKNDAPESDLNL